MTTYLLPCGLSVHDGLKVRENSAPGASLTRLARDEASWRPHARAKQGQELVDSWFAALKSAADDVKLTKWKSSISAETSSLAARADNALQASDRVVLLASDTDDGMAAALTVAYLIADGDQARLRAATAPTDETEARTFLSDDPGAVTVVRVKGLTPQSSDLRPAVGAIGRVLRAVLDIDNGLVEVHLTGGYKLILLHMLAMTETLYSQTPKRVSAWYLFEGTPKAVKIGLRRFPQEYLQNMQKELTRVRYKKPFSGRTFEGIAWELDDTQQPRLTDFGEGYLAVLGGPSTPDANDGAR